jgi:hypothetical protein
VEKQKILMLKKQRFKREENGKTFTFDFEGDPVNCTINQNRINYYEMNSNIKDVETKQQQHKATVTQ